MLLLVNDRGDDGSRRSGDRSAERSVEGGMVIAKVGQGRESGLTQFRTTLTKTRWPSDPHDPKEGQGDRSLFGGRATL